MRTNQPSKDVLLICETPKEPLELDVEITPGDLERWHLGGAALPLRSDSELLEQPRRIAPLRLGHTARWRLENVHHHQTARMQERYYSRGSEAVHKQGGRRFASERCERITE